MKNRRGFLLAEETLKMVIAVICIGFLVYLLMSLYFSKINDAKFKQAESLLKDSPESIKVKIENLKNINPETAHLTNPSGWSLFGFVSKRPNSCIESCLCICDDVVDVFGLFENRQINECQEEGTCLEVDNLEKDFEIEINMQLINIQEVNGKISISEK